MENIIEMASTRFNETLFSYLQPTIEGKQHLVKEQALHEERIIQHDERMKRQSDTLDKLKSMIIHYNCRELSLFSRQTGHLRQKYLISFFGQPTPTSSLVPTAPIPPTASLPPAASIEHPNW